MTYRSTEEVYAKEAEDSLSLNILPFEFRLRVNEFSGAELKVFMSLLGHANAASKRVWIGRDRIVRETGLSLRNGVTTALAGLVRKGWIVRYNVRKAKTKKRQTATTFCKWPPAVPGSLYARVTERTRRKPQAQKEPTDP